MKEKLYELYLFIIIFVTLVFWGMLFELFH